MRRKGMISGALLVLGGCLTWAAAAWGQVTVLTLVEGSTGVARTERAVLTPLGGFEQEALAVDQVLVFGDELSSVAAEVAVVLRCAAQDGDSEMTLSSPFRVVLMPTGSGRGCALSLQGGTAEVLAGNDTEIHSGEVTLGSERTQYGMFVGRTREALAKEAYVFEGAVRVEGIDETPVKLNAGKRLSLARAGQVRPMALQRGDIQRTASLYARIDASRTALQGQALQRSYRELVVAHSKVLSQPEQAEPRVNLAVARLNLNVKTPSTLHYLTQAQTLNTANTALLAKTAMVKGMVYQEMGKTESAQTEFRAATAIDPDVSKAKVGQAYNINPQVLQRIKVPSQRIMAPRNLELMTPVPSPQIELKTRVAPARVRPGEPVKIMVYAAANDQPLADATVYVASGGGWFDGGLTGEVRGQSNHKGYFETGWRCEPCASAYKMKIDVEKTGYQSETGWVTVDIDY